MSSADELSAKLKELVAGAMKGIWSKANVYHNTTGSGPRIIEADLLDLVRAASVTTASHLAAVPDAPVPAKRASDLLADGIDALRRRAAEYDRESGERSAGPVAAAWSAVTGKAMTEAEAWLFLVLLKAVRLHTAPGRHDDSATDGAVYFALMGESKGGCCGTGAKEEIRDVRPAVGYPEGGG